MQLRRASSSPRALLAGAAFVATSAVAGSPRSEVVDFHSRGTYWHESLPYGHMTVFTPAAQLTVKPVDAFGISGGWSADVVSGASIKTRNGSRGADPDAVSSASVKDFRQVVNGGISLQRKLVTFSAGYNYSWEHDYRSHSVDVSAKAELLQKSMELQIAYSHNWDSVCDRIQLDPDPTRRLALDKSDGCFQPSPKLTTHPIAIDGIQGSWTQLWTPTFATQVAGSIQLLDGFLSNPYREVNIGVSSPAQEYEPATRVRLAAGVRLNWYLKPLETALRLGGRIYRDTWDVRAVTADAELERYIFVDALRLRLRGRYYTQGHAAFYSDDYLIEPRGAYFTGDRELSTIRSWLGGARIAYGPVARNGRWLGLLSRAEVSLGGDYVAFRYPDFTINGVPLEKKAWIASLGVSLLF